MHDNSFSTLWKFYFETYDCYFRMHKRIQLGEPKKLSNWKVHLMNYFKFKNAFFPLVATRTTEFHLSWFSSLCFWSFANFDFGLWLIMINKLFPTGGSNDMTHALYSDINLLPVSQKTKIFCCIFCFVLFRFMVCLFYIWPHVS